MVDKKNNRVNKDGEYFYPDTPFLDPTKRVFNLPEDRNRKRLRRIAERLEKYPRYLKEILNYPLEDRSDLLGFFDENKIPLAPEVRRKLRESVVRDLKKARGLPDDFRVTTPTSDKLEELEKLQKKREKEFTDFNQEVQERLSDIAKK